MDDLECIEECLERERLEDVLDTDIVHRPYLFHVIPIKPRSKELTEGQSASLVLQEEFEKDAQKPLDNSITERIMQPEKICKNHTII